MPDDKDCQDEWEAVINDPKKYVSLLVGQMDDEEQRAEMRYFGVGSDHAEFFPFIP